MGLKSLQLEKQVKSSFTEFLFEFTQYVSTSTIVAFILKYSRAKYVETSSPVSLPY